MIEFHCKPYYIESDLDYRLEFKKKNILHDVLKYIK